MLIIGRDLSSGVFIYQLSSLTSEVLYGEFDGGDEGLGQ